MVITVATTTYRRQPLVTANTNGWLLITNHHLNRWLPTSSYCHHWLSIIAANRRSPSSTTTAAYRPPTTIVDHWSLTIATLIANHCYQPPPPTAYRPPSSTTTTAHPLSSPLQPLQLMNVDHWSPPSSPQSSTITITRHHRSLITIADFQPPTPNRSQLSIATTLIVDYCQRSPSLPPP